MYYCNFDITKVKDHFMKYIIYSRIHKGGIMRRFLLIFSFIVLFLCLSLRGTTKTPGLEDKVKNVLSKMEWFGHDAFKLSDDVIIYIDPFRLEGELEKADIILITHPHSDHLSPDDIEKIKKDGTIIIGTPDCSEKCPDINPINLGEKKEIKGIKIETVPAYNINKKYHPKEKNWVGYIITVDDVRIYHAGDTDNIPEMEDIKCDIVLLPVSGTYVMTAEEAVLAAIKINPIIAIPMHYGVVIGSKADALKFKELLKGKIEVIIFPIPYTSCF